MVGLAERLTHLVCRVFHYDIKREQMQYLQVMIDPKGNLEEISIDDFILAVRQSVEAGVRVRSKLEMQPVMIMLAPLAQNIQQALTLIRQAFREASFVGESGLMTMEMLSSVLQELLPPFKTQQLRYLLCILAHQCSSRRHGIISFKDVQAFLRMSSLSSLKGMGNTADAMADSESPADVASYILSGVSAKEAASIASADGRLGKAPAESLVKPQVVKKGALDRLKERLKDQRPQMGSSMGDDLDQETGAKPLLQPFPPPLPVFLDIAPPLPTQLAPQEPVKQVVDQAISVVPLNALDILIQKAEALQNALADASLTAPERKRMEMTKDENEIDHLSMLQFVSDPGIALNFAQDAIMLPRLNTGTKMHHGVDEEVTEMWKEQTLLHHLFFPASVDVSLDLTETNEAASTQAPEQIESIELINVNEVTVVEEVEEVSIATASDEQGAPKPGLHIIIHEARLPQAPCLDNLPSTSLSLVVRSSCLMPSAQGIHWPLSKRFGLEGETFNDPTQPLLNLTLPIQESSSLPCQVIVELWSDSSTLIGVSQLGLSNSAANSASKSASASVRGDFPMSNPLLSLEEEEDLASSSHLNIEARVSLNSSQEQRVKELQSFHSIQHTFR